MTHIRISKVTIIGSNNGLSPGRHQAIIWTNDKLLCIGPLGTNLGEILIGIYIFSFKKMHLKMSSAKGRPFCLGLNVLNSPIGMGHWVCAHLYKGRINTWVIFLGASCVITRNKYRVLTRPAGRRREGAFWVWAQPMRDSVTLSLCLPLAGPIHWKIPVMDEWKEGGKILNKEICLCLSFSYSTMTCNAFCVLLALCEKNPL